MIIYPEHRFQPGLCTTVTFSLGNLKSKCTTSWKRVCLNQQLGLFMFLWQLQTKQTEVAMTLRLCVTDAHG